MEILATEASLQEIIEGYKRVSSNIGIYSNYYHLLARLSLTLNAATLTRPLSRTQTLQATAN